MVRTDARVCRGQVVRLEEVCLGLEGGGDEDGVLGDYGEFVEDESVRGTDGSDG